MHARRPLLPVLILVVAPAGAAASPERRVAAIEAGGCELSLGADEPGRTLRLRVTPYGCRVSRASVEQLLDLAFARVDPPRLDGPYTSLFIGRLVDFPWLAAHLVSTAAGDRRWDARSGRAVGVGTYAFVASVLSAPEATAPFEAAMRRRGYRIRSATVEKVLVLDLRSAREYAGPRPPGKLPFDAMVWFVLERLETPP